MNSPAEKKTNALMTSAGGAGGFMDAEEESGILSPPRLKLLQKMSAEIDTIDGAKSGLFFNQSSGELVKEITFIPVALKQEFITFTQDNKVDQKFYSEAEAKAGLGLEYWRARNNAVFMVVGDDPMPVIYNFHGLASKVFKTFYKNARFTRRDLWASQYTLTSAEQDTANGKVHVPKISLAKTITEEQYAMTSQVAQELNAVINQVQTHDAAPQPSDKSTEDIPF